MGTVHHLSVRTPEAAPAPPARNPSTLAAIYKAGMIEGERATLERLGISLPPPPRPSRPVTSLADHTASACSAILAASGPSS